MKMNIVTATPKDRDLIREIYHQAFEKTENQIVANLAVTLLESEAEARVLNLVAESDGVRIGHVAFSPIWEKSQPDPIGYILAPLAVDPAWQNHGIGTALVREGIQRIRSESDEIILVYGDPAYYGRFGFTPELAENFIPPYPLAYPSGWQALGGDAGAPSASPIPIKCIEALNLPELW